MVLGALMFRNADGSIALVGYLGISISVAMLTLGPFYLLAPARLVDVVRGRLPLWVVRMLGCGSIAFGVLTLVKVLNAPPGGLV